MKGPSIYAEYWTSPNSEADHYKRHASEFGYTKITEYSKAAIKFKDSDKRGLFKFRSKNNSVTMFNRKTGQFIVISENGKIITYYKATESHFWNKLEENSGILY